MDYISFAEANRRGLIEHPEHLCAPRSCYQGDPKRWICPVCDKRVNMFLWKKLCGNCENLDGHCRKSHEGITYRERLMRKESWTP